MSDRIRLERADNLDDAVIAANKVVEWARGHRGADAHLVFDYVPVEGGAIPGSLNGVTVQWDHQDVNAEDDSTDEVMLQAAEAVHVRPGDTLVKAHRGFEVLAEVSE